MYLGTYISEYPERVLRYSWVETQPATPSEQVSRVERASEASSAEQVNEWAVQANERMDERVAQ